MTVAELFILLGIEVDEKSWRKGFIAINSLTHGMTRMIERGFEGLVGMAEKAGENAVHIRSLGQQMGMTAQATQEWGYIAEQAGSNVDELSIGMVRLAKNMRAAVQGRDTVGTRALHGMGLTNAEMAQALKNPELFDAALMKISDRYHEMGNNANRAGISNELFGRQAKSMVSDLARGSKGLAELRAGIRERHAILSNDEVENVANLGNQFNNIRQELRMFGAQAVGVVAPELTKMLKAATAWIATHRELLKDTIAKGLSAIMFGFRVLAQVIVFATEHTTTFKIILGVLLAMFIAIKAAAFAAFVSALAPMAPLLLELTAIVAILAAFIYLGYQIHEHWPEIVKAVSDAWTNFVDDVKSAVSAVGGFFEDIGAGIRDFFEGVVNWIVDRLNGIIGVVESIVNKSIGILNHLPGVSIDTTSIGRIGHVGADKGAANAQTANAARGASERTAAPINVGPTTVNITAGDAKDARRQFDADSIDRMNRHAVAALDGGVR